MDALLCVVMQFVGGAHDPCANTTISLSPFHPLNDGDLQILSYTKQWESSIKGHKTHHTNIYFDFFKGSIGTRSCTTKNGKVKVDFIFKFSSCHSYPVPVVLKHIILTSVSDCFRPMHVSASFALFTSVYNCVELYFSSIFFIHKLSTEVESYQRSFVF